MNSAAASQCAAALEALLLEPMLAPLAKDCDALSPGMLARSIAQHDTHGFAALLAARLEEIA